VTGPLDIEYCYISSLLSDVTRVSTINVRVQVRK
jgi:hypothetical protein